MEFPYGLIQVAGVHDASELRMLLDNDVDLVGFPLRLTVNEEDLPETNAVELCHANPGKCCLITYLDEVQPIVEFVRQLGVRFVQLHGSVDPHIMPQLIQALPEVRFIKSLIVGKENLDTLLDTMNAFSPYVWAFITDSFDPDSGAEGATGLIHDWAASRQLVKSSSRPVILAGGLTPDNVADAILAVRPHGVDVHTGVENEFGRKDSLKVRSFVEHANLAFGRLSRLC